MKASSWRELQQGESVTPADEDKQLLHHDCYQPDASLSKQKPNKKKHVWLLESYCFSTVAVVACLLDISKRIFSDWLIKMLLDSMLWKTKIKTKSKAYQNDQLLKGKESRKEGKEGRTELVNGGKKKGRKWMNERVREWVRIWNIFT